MITKLLKISVMLIVFILITSVSAFLALSFFIKSEDSVVVPDMTGKEVVQVLEILSSLGLKIQMSGSEFSNQVPRNHVIYQDPDPGTVIKKGRDVHIVFSKGIQSVIMPSLRHTPTQELDLLLSNSGLLLKSQSFIHDDEVPKDSIIAQYPETGSEISQGTGVEILISLGRKPVDYMLGNMKGMAYNNAVYSLEKIRMKLGDIRSVESETAEPDSVTGQYPLPGSLVREGTTVSLTINRNDNKDTYPTDSGPRIFIHQMDYGFINRHVRVQMSSRGETQDIYNEYVQPGEKIWLSVPANTKASLSLYVDDTLVKTQEYY